MSSTSRLRALYTGVSARIGLSESGASATAAAQQNSHQPQSIATKHDQELQLQQPDNAPTCLLLDMNILKRISRCIRCCLKFN